MLRASASDDGAPLGGSFLVLGFFGSLGFLPLSLSLSLSLSLFVLSTALPVFAVLPLPLPPPSSIGVGAVCEPCGCGGTIFCVPLPLGGGNGLPDPSGRAPLADAPIGSRDRSRSLSATNTITPA